MRGESLPSYFDLITLCNSYVVGHNYLGQSGYMRSDIFF